jgi:hypothetical protein
MVGGDNQQFAILKPGGNDIDPPTPHPELARENPLLTDCQVGKDPFASLAALSRVRTDAVTVA